MDFLRHDKKASHGRVYFILPRGIGDVVITPDVSMGDLTEAIDKSKD
jgi:3-dehydroquinate synthetase